MLLAVYDQSVGHEFVPSYTSITPKFALIPFPQGIRQRQNSSRRRLVFMKQQHNELNGRHWTETLTVRSRFEFQR